MVDPTLCFTIHRFTHAQIFELKHMFSKECAANQLKNLMLRRLKLWEQCKNTARHLFNEGFAFPWVCSNFFVQPFSHSWELGYNSVQSLKHTRRAVRCVWLPR